MCDENCDKYGDCCLNSQYFNAAQQRRAASSFKCTAVEEAEYVYTKVDCPPFWQNIDVRRKCEKSAIYSVDDPLLMTPVTSSKSNITYGNIFCAICNKDIGVTYWGLNLDCQLNNDKLSNDDIDYVEKNLSFNHTHSYWQVQVKQRYYKCDLILSITQALKQQVRRCVPTIKTCPATWGKDEIRQRCESYTLIVHKNSKPTESFRNIHCAICNSIPVQLASCEKQKESTSAIDTIFRILPFSIIFDFNGGRSVGQIINCTTNQVYDRFFRRCRNIIPEESVTVETDRRTLRETLNCPKVTLDQAEFQLLNDSAVYVPKFDKILEPGKFIYHSYGSLEICVDTADAMENRVAYRPYYSFITFIGIGISIICLCVHLVVFAIVKELRNLSGKNLASFCFALLIAYSSFALGDVFEGKFCFANAVVTFYFFLASFTWMLIMSFDVWRTLRIATKELRVSSGKQWRKFFIYSFCSWILPAKIVLMAVLVDLCPNNFVPERFKPHFGVRTCWFGQGPPILVFFGLPVLLVLICNLVFFLSSTYMIYSSHSMTRYSASPGTKRDFRLYARLALLMGLTWIFGLVAGFLNNEVLWVLFILSNTSIGLFIFIAFTCRRKVLHALKNLKRDSVLNLPAFSWSMNSSEVDTKSQMRSEKQTSNTYY